ncbi:MAG: DUF4062 domain-containing protein [Nitrospirae bacterium]|nr:DUF4062 domain-containing protein [Nitrospirota bacterium]
MAERSVDPASKQRLVRVFISSTFRDMQAERDRLVKFTFPELRRRCRERQVEFVEVDLRWGVTEEQAERGEVLPICLAEIERCRPYFIGMMGERYGFIPRQIEPELIKTQPWLEKHRERSLTELEILHGVLNNPDMAGRAFFYFRDPSYVQRIHAEEQSDFLCEDDASRQKLLSLKNQIRQSPVFLKEPYPNPEALGQFILEDLWRAIDQEFPKGQEPGPLDREASEHAAFAQSRAKVYIGREEYFNRLDEQITGNGPPLVVLGESGSGKSALLSNWALQYQQAHPDDFLLIHFIGSSPQSTDYTAVLRRIMGEIKRRYDFSHGIPTDPEKLREAFPNWLSMAAARGKAVFIVDALNQLEDRDNAPDLIWLPDFIPPEIRLIVSTLPGRSLSVLQKRGWPSYTVAPLNPQERRQVSTDYLAQFQKALNPVRTQRIIDAPQSANPLYLRGLLQELRLFGEHDRLDTRIGHYLEADTVKALYQKILERLESDYEANAPGLTGQALSWIWAARRGLTESELLELLAIPQAVWSPLYLALVESLVSRSGLLGFFHDYLREAVEERYLPERSLQQATHLRLADYFGSRALDARTVDEIPYQLSQAKSWIRLYDLLGNLTFFDAAWTTNQFEVKAYWAQIEDDSPLRMVDAYQPVLRTPGVVTNTNYVWNVAILLNDTGHTGEALSLHGWLVDHFQRIGDTESLQASLGNQALILRAWGRLDEAIALHKEEERICREMGNKHSLQISLGNQGLILKDQGDLDGAMALYKEQERICKELGNKDGLQASLGNQANIHYVRGDLDRAMALEKEKERICKELGNKDSLPIGLGNQGLILKARGDLDGAMALCKEQERICKEMGNKHSLQISLGNQGNILKAWGRLNEAMALHKEEERICKELGDKYNLQVSLGNQGNILYAWGRLNEAMALHKEQERICKELGNKDNLQTSLGNQALILKAWGRLNEAMALHKEQERICKELGNKDNLQTSLGNQAVILYAWGRLDEAMALHKEQERICKELGNKASLQHSLGNQANILYTRGDLNGAMALYKEQERLCKELGNRNSLQCSLGNQAVILYAWGRLDEAMALHKEEERICKEMGNKDGLQRSLGNQALILKAWGRLNEAMALHKEQERICKELGNKDGLARSLANQANLLSEKMNHPGEALPLAEEAYRIVTEHGLAALAKQIKLILDAVRSKVGGTG